MDKPVHQGAQNFFLRAPTKLCKTFVFLQAKRSLKFICISGLGLCFFVCLKSVSIINLFKRFDFAILL